MLADAEKSLLKKIARESIEYGLSHSYPIELDISAMPNTLTRFGASFVTLHEHGELRGCIGSLEAFRPLAEDVVFNAYAAAFNDPRFAPMQPGELPIIDIEISVLSTASQIPCRHQQDLLSELQPFKDGLIIEDNFHRATFLPSVWESLPEPSEFLQHLKLKAGLPANYWSDELRCYRYTTESF